MVTNGGAGRSGVMISEVYQNPRTAGGDLAKRAHA